MNDRRAKVLLVQHAVAGRGTRPRPLLTTLRTSAWLMAAPRGTTAVFVYGTLKRGCFNHHILRRSLENPGPTQPALYPSSDPGAALGSTWETVEPHPLLLKPERHVPALLPQPGAGQRVLGELYHCDVRIPPSPSPRSGGRPPQ